MDRSRPIERRARLSIAAVAVAVALCALLPATAAADTTSLTLVAAPEIVPYNGVSILTGTFMNTTSMTATGGLPILVQSGASATGPWTDIAVVTTLDDIPAYYTGTYTFVVMPRDKTFYRMVFIGDGSLDGATSAAVAVTPGVYLSKPKVPYDPVRHGVKFTIRSNIMPKHPAGLKNVAKVKLYRYNGTKWVYKFSKWMKTANYLNFTKLTVELSIKQTGRWKARAYAPADALHAASESKWSYVFRIN
jgi:hypothetical protein